MGAPAEPTVFEFALSCEMGTAVNKDEYGGRVSVIEATLAARHGAEKMDRIETKLLACESIATRLFRHMPRALTHEAPRGACMRARE